jgi:hypothetical protein
MVVHDLSSRVRLIARTRCENHDSSTPHSPDVSFRVRFGSPYRSKVPNQVDFKISVWGTHDSTTRHLSWLAQDTDVLSRETAGLEIANDLVDQDWILKQTNCRFCHIDLHQFNLRHW